jgi:hypothetical protein
MLDYASPILYIRSPAAYGRGCAEFPSIPLPRTRVNKALRRTLRGVEQHRFACAVTSYIVSQRYHDDEHLSEHHLSQACASTCSD